MNSLTSIISIFMLCSLYKSVHSNSFNSFIEHCTQEDSVYRECDLVKFRKNFQNRTMRLSGIAIAYDDKYKFQKIFLGTRNCIERKNGQYLRLLPNAYWHHRKGVTVVIIVSPTIGPMSFFLDDEEEIDIEFPNTHVFILNGELKTYGAKRRCVVPIPEMNGMTMYHFNELKREDAKNPSKFHQEKIFLGRKHTDRCTRERREDNFTETNMIKKIENMIPELFTECRLNCEQTEIIIAKNLSLHHPDPDAGKFGELIIYHLNDTHNNNTFVPNVNQMETILYDYDHEPGYNGIAKTKSQQGNTRSLGGGQKYRKRSPLRVNARHGGNEDQNDQLENDLRGGRNPLSHKIDPILNSKYNNNAWSRKKDANNIIPHESASMEDFESEKRRIFKRLTLSSMMRLKNAAQSRKGVRELECLERIEST